MAGVFIALAVVCAYLIGSIPSAYIVGRLRKGTDIRQIGSRNMGAMNAFYQVGFGWGTLVLAVDIGKGAVAVALARWLGVPEIAQLLAGVVVVLGHGFPVFLKFRGGKGGAASMGVLFFLMPWSIPLCVSIFGITLLITRYPTLSYSVALLCFPFFAWFFYHRWEWVVFSVGLLVLLLGRYIPRIKEMRSKAGSWKHVVRRKGLQDRF